MSDLPIVQCNDCESILIRYKTEHGIAVEKCELCVNNAENRVLSEKEQLEIASVIDFITQEALDKTIQQANISQRAQMRFETAKAAMQGLLSAQPEAFHAYLDTAGYAVKHADALLAELEKSDV